MVTPTWSPPEAEVAAAVDRWGRSITGAPRRCSTLITDVVANDQIIHRVFTEIVRRDLVEERAPAHERRPSRPRLDYASVDPFAFSPDLLRAETLHVVPCNHCLGSGGVVCGVCSGRGMARCLSCNGMTKVLNPRTNRMNKCKPCKGTGEAGCSSCSSSGRVPCGGCGASGHQRVCLTFTENRRGRVTVVPQTPVVHAHRQLLEARALTTDEIGAFAVRNVLASAGPIATGSLSEEARSAIEGPQSTLDLRCERIVGQQYLQLAVIRRDVSFRMCGTSGTLVLSGRDLIGATTPDSLRPIRRRFIVLPVLVVGMAIAGLLIWAAAVGGRTTYFEAANGVAAPLWLASVVLSVGFLGGLLRAWRSGLRVRGLTRRESTLGLLWAAATVGIIAVGLTHRPEPQEVEEALSAGDLERASIVAEALRETRGETSEVLALEDAVLLAQADLGSGEARLAKLDLVAARGGERAQAAAAAARRDRIQAIDGLLESGRSREAIEAIEASFAGSWPDDPELAERIARGHEGLGAACASDTCRWSAATAARLARNTADRRGAAEAARARLVAALIDREVHATSPTERLIELGAKRRFADEVFAAASTDQDLQREAVATKQWALEQRASTAVLGASVAGITEVFPGIKRVRGDVSSVSLEGAQLFFSFDSGGACDGLYVVGPAGRRALHSEEWPAERLLSQALGRSASIQKPRRAGATMSSWKEANTPIAARWHEGELVELRVGNATP